MGKRGFNVGYNFETWPTENITLKIKASSNGVETSKELSITPESTQLKVVLFSYEALGLVYQAGIMVQIKIDMEASNGVHKTYASATYNVLMGSMQDGTII